MMKNSKTNCRTSMTITRTILLALLCGYCFCLLLAARTDDAEGPPGRKCPTDKVVIGPGGVFVWYYGPVDDATPGAGTEDIITLDPSANTFNVKYIVWGRSA